MTCRVRLWLKVRNVPYYIGGLALLVLVLRGTLDTWCTTRSGEFAKLSAEQLARLGERERDSLVRHTATHLGKELVEARESESVGNVESKHGTAIASQLPVVEVHHGDGEDAGCQRPTLSRCEVVQVAIVCSGFGASRDVVTLIKSILFHSRNPMHFHFISDQRTQSVLSTLFRTWQLPEVQISFYAADAWTSEVGWMPNQDSSQDLRIMKLLITSVLPRDLDKVIALDIDLTFAADIAELWLQFRTLIQQGKSIGLVENQSDRHLETAGKDFTVWPALGRGFNTGVMLLRLGEMRRLAWTQLWKTVARRNTMTLGMAERADDQDIVNALLKARPDMHHVLPCQWNLQISTHELCQACYAQASPLKIIHWSSPEKQAVKANNAEFFRSLHTTFLEYDGNLLRQRLPCTGMEGAADSTTAQTDGDGCLDFRQAGQVRYRTHLYFLNYTYAPPQPDANDVTLVAQLSLDRFHVLETLCNHWEGPMSLALFLSDSEAKLFLKYARESAVISNRTNIGFHVVYKSGSFYPVNYLRNVALDQVRQPYVFLADIDFLPMHGMYPHLKSTLSEMDSTSARTALVVPAFETLLYRMPFPTSKASLVQMLDDQKVFPFHYHLWPKGHAPTDFARWRTSTSQYRARWAVDFEPYLVVPTSVTRYDARFVGFGWNKATHVMELEAQKYEFHVLPEAFTIHMPHALSLDNAKFFSGTSYRECMALLKTEFVEDLVRKYGAPAMQFMRRKKKRKVTLPYM